MAIMIDFFYPSGKKHRVIFWITEIRQSEQVVSYRLQTYSKENGQCEILAKHDLPRAIAIEFLKGECRNHARLCGPEGTHVVTPTGWILWRKGKKFHPENLDKYPFAYKWDERKKRWIKKKQSSETKPELRVRFLLGQNRLQREQCHRCNALIEQWGYFDYSQNIWLCPDCGQKQIEEN